MWQSVDSQQVSLTRWGVGGGLAEARGSQELLPEERERERSNETFDFLETNSKLLRLANFMARCITLHHAAPRCITLQNVYHTVNCVSAM